jgi:Ca-activated chloride channel family protein
MHFLWPDLLWLLPIVPLAIAAYVYALRRRKKAALRYASLLLVRDALGPGQWLRRHLPAVLIAAALMSALLGVARPSALFTLPNAHQTIVLAMDVSRSMRATDIPPSRMVAAQNAVKEFVQELPPNVRVGIVTFAGTAAVVQTPTHNREELIAAVDRFQLQRQTAIGSGLLMALSLLLPDSGIDLEEDVFDSAFSRRSGAAPLSASPKAERKDWKPVPPGSYNSGAGRSASTAGRRVRLAASFATLAVYSAAGPVVPAKRLRPPPKSPIRGRKKLRERDAAVAGARHAVPASHGPAGV